MTVGDLVPTAIENVCARTAQALVGDQVSPQKLLRAHQVLVADRQAFADSFAAWAFLLSALPTVRLAREAIDRAHDDDRRLRRLAVEDRATYRRMRDRAERAGGALLEEFKRYPAPVSLKAGRRNETELRDLLIAHVRRMYPAQGATGGAWRGAIAIAALLWPGAAHSAELKRDTRRRLKGAKHLRSRAAIYYADACRRGGFARVLDEAAAKLVRDGESR